MNKRNFAVLLCLAPVVGMAAIPEIKLEDVSARSTLSLKDTIENISCPDSAFSYTFNPERTAKLRSYMGVQLNVKEYYNITQEQNLYKLIRLSKDRKFCSN